MNIRCVLGVHRWVQRDAYPCISYCERCRAAMDERADGYVPPAEKPIPYTITEAGRAMLEGK